MNRRLLISVVSAVVLVGLAFWLWPSNEVAPHDEPVAAPHVSEPTESATDSGPSLDEDSTTANATVIHPITVRGRVLESGVPVRGATVSDRAKPSINATTDDRGEFVLQGLSPSDVELVAEHEGRFAAKDLALEPLVEPPPITLELSPAMNVHGIVRDESSHPIADARLTIPALDLVTHTAEDGRFAFPPMANRTWLSLRASAEGFTHAAIDRPGSEEIEIVLLRGVAVQGRVISRDNQPVQATVNLYQGSEKHPFDTLATVDGGFRFAAAAGDVLLKLEAQGFARKQVAVQAPSNTTITLDPECRLELTFVDVARQPMGNAAVFLDGSDGGLRGSGSADARGRLTLAGLEPDHFVIRAGQTFGTMREAASIDLARGESKSLTIAVAAPARIAGTFQTRSGKPIPHATLVLRQKLGDGKQNGSLLTTDAEGRFEGEAFEAGTIELRSTEGDSPASLSVEAPAEHILFIADSETGIIVGRVLDDRGAPVHQFEVDHQSFNSRDGRFEVSGQREEKRSIRVEAKGFAALERDIDTPTERTDLGDLRLERGTTAKGVVIDAVTRKPIAGAEVQAVEPQSPFVRYRAARAETDLWGAFKIPHAPVASSVLQVEHPDYRRVRQPRTGGMDEIALTPAAPLEVHVRDGSGAAVRADSADLFGRGELIRLQPDGDLFRGKMTELGEHTLSVHAKGYGTTHVPITLTDKPMRFDVQLR